MVRKFIVFLPIVSVVLYVDSIIEKKSKAARIYSLDESVFNNISEESAYWIGFLMADGCIMSSGNSYIVELSLNIKDKKHLEKFQKFLKTNRPMTYHKNNIARISINSLKIGNKLISHGIVPRKSKTEEVIGLQNNKHFWRGMIDGDGSIIINRTYPRIDLVGSHKILSQYRKFIKKIIYKNKCSIRKHETIYRVTVEGKGAFKLIDYFYKNNKVSLIRKNKIANYIVDNIESMMTGHKKGEEHPKSKLLNVERKKIKKLRNKGKSHAELADKFGVSKALIYRIIDG